MSKRPLPAGADALLTLVCGTLATHDPVNYRYALKAISANPEYEWVVRFEAAKMYTRLMELDAARAESELAPP